MTAAVRPRVLLTDHAWPGVQVESSLCDAAGFDLVEAPPDASEEVLATLAADVEGILTCWAKVTARVIATSPGLQVVSRMGVGLDNIDVAAAGDRGIVVTRVPDYCAEEVSDHVIAMAHAWARCILAGDRDIRAGLWAPARYAPRRVRTLVTGVWGPGPLGRRTAEKLAALGCEVLADDRHPERAPAGVRPVPAETLLARCDVLSLHLPLTPETTGLMNAGRLAAMKPGSLLSTPAGARQPDVILTPHFAFSSADSVLELRRRATEDLLRVLAGQPAHHPVP